MSRISKTIDLHAFEPLNWVILGVVFLLLGGSVYLTWTLLQPSHYATSGSSTPVVTETPKEEAVPELQLNQANNLEAQSITVDPNALGRPNPFQKL